MRQHADEVKLLEEAKELVLNVLEGIYHDLGAEAIPDEIRQQIADSVGRTLGNITNHSVRESAEEFRDLIEESRRACGLPPTEELAEVKEETAAYSFIPRKHDISRTLERWDFLIAVVDTVHAVNAQKYPGFEWYYCPDHEHDATIADNINAALRHLLIYSAGRSLDTESQLPHLFHMICRVAMAAVVISRNVMHDGKPFCWKPTTGKNHGVKPACSYLSPELVGVLTHLPVDRSEYSHLPDELDDGTVLGILFQSLGALYKCAIGKEVNMHAVVCALGNIFFLAESLAKEDYRKLFSEGYRLDRAGDVAVPCSFYSPFQEAVKDL